MTLSIIIPIFNEKNTVLALLKKVTDINLGEIKKEIINGLNIALFNENFTYFSCLFFVLYSYINQIKFHPAPSSILYLYHFIE